MRRLIIIASIACFHAGFLRAQDPVFSQYYNSEIYLNPAMIGEEKDIFLNYAHRSQWRNLEYPYTTHQISAIFPFYRDKHKTPESQAGSFGASLYSDHSGEGKNFRTIGGNASYAYDLQLNKAHMMSFAAQAGFVQKSVDKDQLQWGEQFNPFIGFDNSIVPSDLDQIDNRTFFDLTLATFWRYYNPNENNIFYSAYGGFVAAHVNNPDESVLDGQENRLPVLYKLHYGIVTRLSQKVFLSGNLLHLMQNDEFQHNIGVYASYALPMQSRGKLTNFTARLGTWYRFGDAFILSAELLTDHFQIGFSYDWNQGTLRYNNRGTGSYEITLGYRFKRLAPPKIRY